MVIISEEDENKVLKIFDEIRKTKRNMTNDEWKFIAKTKYALKYFAISSEYIHKLREKEKKEVYGSNT